MTAVGEFRSTRCAPPRQRLVWLCVATLAVAIAIPPAVSMGPLAGTMTVHILLMNALAPLLALALAGRLSPVPALANGRGLAIATIGQIVVLWAVHLPPILSWATTSHGGHLALQAILLAAALWFWAAVLSQHGDGRWRSLLALAITGKLFCLLGILMVFAPRSLYPLASPALVDQQLAGLLMVIACPLSYLVAAVMISERWLRELAGPRVVGAKEAGD